MIIWARKIPIMITKKSFFSILYILTCIPAFAQEPFKVAYEDLKPYEGLYEFSNHTTLKMAASPADTLLYAIINKSRYALRPKARDVFLDATNNPVTFLHDQSGGVIAYTLNRDTLRLITRDISFPVQMWFPRIIPNREA